MPEETEKEKEKEKMMMVMKKRREKAKKERLERAGWRFGTALEFLGLPADALTNVEARPPLVDSLKQRARRPNPSDGRLAGRAKPSTEA